MSVVGQEAETALYESLRARQSVDAFVVHTPQADDQRLTLLRSLDVPFVVHGRVGDQNEGYFWIDMNNRSAFEEATRYLIELGHRRIAFVNGLEMLDFARRRRIGYDDALTAAGLQIDPALLLSEEMTEENGYRAARQVLDLDTPPTAFLASSYILAIGMRRAIEERGLKLGKDISLITHDDEDLQRVAFRRPTRSALSNSSTFWSSKAASKPMPIGHAKPI